MVLITLMTEKKREGAPKLLIGSEIARNVMTLMRTTKHPSHVTAFLTKQPQQACTEICTSMLRTLHGKLPANDYFEKTKK